MATPKDETERGQWAKTIPTAIFMALILQSIAAGSWAGSTSQRVAILESYVLEQRTRGERLARIETRLDALMHHQESQGN